MNQSIPSMMIAALMSVAFSCSSSGDDTTNSTDASTTTNATAATTTTDPTTSTGPTGTDTTAGSDPTDATNSDGTTVEPTGHDTEDTTTADTTDPLLPTCDDGMVNQQETDVDCGGPNCSACPEGSTCAEDSDCTTGSCVVGTCVNPACDDGVKNGDETDVDCGAACPPCADGLGCAAPADCQSGVCAGDFCAAPGCGDGVLNGDESDLDCGGSCTGCEEGEICGGDPDCLSQYCDNGLCAPADCLVDADCDEFNSDCSEGSCTPEKTCVANPTNENSPCDDGNLCSMDEYCEAGACVGGLAVDCSNLNDACNVGMCDVKDGACVQMAANDNNPCDDMNSCTLNEVCMAGTCADENPLGYLFYEPFADNSQGWTLGTEYQIGPAIASNCANSCPGQDPATDHTDTDDNGVAGVNIGGCAITTIHTDYCMTSPIVDTSAEDTVWLTFWRHLHSDYTPYMQNKVQVFDGNGWVQVFATGGSPCTNDMAWSQQAYDVTAYKNANFQVRFCHNVASGGAYNSGSWSIDDVVIGPAQCTP